MEFDLSALTHFPEVLEKLQIAFSDLTELSSTHAEVFFKQKHPCCVKFLGFLFLARSYLYFLRVFFLILIIRVCSVLIFLPVVSVQCEVLPWELEPAHHGAVGGLFLPAFILVFVGLSCHLALFKMLSGK